MENIIKNWLLKLRDELLSLKGSPHYIATSFAVGLVLGILPGTGPLAAVAVSIVFKLNKPAAIIGSLITNTWTTIFFFAGSVAIGQWLTKIGLFPSTNWEHVVPGKNFSWTELGSAAVPMIVSALILALAVGLLGYFIGYLIMKIFKKIRVNGSQES